jgi:hypothetical protein
MLIPLMKPKFRIVTTAVFAAGMMIASAQSPGTTRTNLDGEIVSLPPGRTNRPPHPFINPPMTNPMPPGVARPVHIGDTNPPPPGGIYRQLRPGIGNPAPPVPVPPLPVNPNLPPEQVPPQNPNLPQQPIPPPQPLPIARPAPSIPRVTNPK